MSNTVSVDVSFRFSCGYLPGNFRDPTLWISSFLSLGWRWEIFPIFCYKRKSLWSLGQWIIPKLNMVRELSAGFCHPPPHQAPGRLGCPEEEKVGEGVWGKEEAGRGGLMPAVMWEKAQGQMETTPLLSRRRKEVFLFFLSLSSWECLMSPNGNVSWFAMQS